MERKKHYQNPKMQENLYQYEMGIDLGAELELENDVIRQSMKESLKTKTLNELPAPCLITAKTDADLKKEA